MKKTISKLLALALTAALVLTGCGGGTGEEANGGENTGSTENGGGESTGDSAAAEGDITDLVIPKLLTRELETFNWLYSQRSEDSENLTQLVDGLLEPTTEGTLAPGLAEEWGSEDQGKTWTFKLREGVKWVDMNGNEKADCVAQDFATSLEWVLNFYKNDSANTTMPLEMIEGAEEYYEWTKTLTQEEAYALDASEGSTFMEMVGIEVPDDYTVIYHCVAPKPYFDSVATYACLYPLAQGLVDELGIDGVKAMNNETMWYNGCYTMTSYIQGNEKTFTKNPTYWDQDCFLFDTVTIKMVESTDVAFQLYQTGEVDYTDLSESNLVTINGNENNEFYDYLVEKPADKYSYQIHFNYNKLLEDGTPDTNWNTAIANEAFRKALYYGWDISEYYTRVNAVNPMVCENNFYTMKGLVYTSDGTDYVELVREELGMEKENGETLLRLDADLAEQYKQQAIEELTPLGVTFPVTMDYYIAASNQVSLDSANVLAQTIANSLGDDFMQLSIKTYVSSSTQEVLNPHLQSITMNGWGADYGDPQNYLGNEVSGNDSAYYSRTQNNINDVEATEATQQLLDTYAEFTSLVEQADAITDDMDARYAAYAKAEAYMIEHVLTLPVYYNVPWCLTKINPYSKMNAMFGSQNEKMKNWETSADGYTTEEMEAIAAEHAAN